jgi:hypothetical protein
MAGVACVGCGAIFEDREGPTHRYTESSPACWAAYGEVVAREYSDSSYAALHGLTVDAYAVQHPGPGSRCWLGPDPRCALNRAFVFSSRIPVVARYSLIR